MPEGDTLARIATVLRAGLVGRTVRGARGRPGGPALGRLVGQRIDGVEAIGKHLLIRTSGGLALHTHLGLHGSWHRYAPGERWRRGAARATAVLECDDAVAVCFDAPRVELLDARAVAIHPALAALGPDLTAAEPDVPAVVARMRQLAAPDATLAEVLLDQRLAAGIGNVVRCEVLFLERVDPADRLADVPDSTLERLLRRASTILRASAAAGARTTVPPELGGGRWVYGRTGRPCRRCGTPVRSALTGTLPRRVHWCPRCQAPSTGELRRASPAGRGQGTDGT